MEFIIGIVISFIIGAIGVGNATLVAPTLSSFLGFPSRKILSLGIYLRKWKVDAKVLAYLLLGGVPSAIIGASVLGELGSKKSETLRQAVLVCTVIVGALLLQLGPGAIF